jgi:hypothetical protein
MNTNQVLPLCYCSLPASEKIVRDPDLPTFGQRYWTCPKHNTALNHKECAFWVWPDNDQQPPISKEHPVAMQQPKPQPIAGMLPITTYMAPTSELPKLGKRKHSDKSSEAATVKQLQAEITQLKEQLAVSIEKTSRLGNTVVKLQQMYREERNKHKICAMCDSSIII